MPCYNPNGKDLKVAIASCLNQTVLPAEILIINDGSDDTSGFSFLKENINPIIRKIDVKHGGPGLARNEGNRVAKGDYLVYLDCDDVISPYYVETVVRIGSEYPQVIFFGSGDCVSMSRPNENPIQYHGIEAQNYMNRIVKGINRTEVRSVWAKAFSRPFLLENNLWFESLQQGEDQLFMYHLSFVATHIIALPSFISYQYQYNENSTSNSFEEVKVNAFIALAEKLKQCLEENDACSKDNIKAREYFFNVAGEYIPRLLKIYYCNHKNPESKRNRYSSAKKLFFHNEIILHAIKNCRLMDCPNWSKRFLLICLKIRFLGIIFSIYEIKK